MSDLGWSRTLVYGGFSIALLVMGLSLALAGTTLAAALGPKLVGRPGG